MDGDDVHDEDAEGEKKEAECARGTGTKTRKSARRQRSKPMSREGEDSEPSLMITASRDAGAGVPGDQVQAWRHGTAAPADERQSAVQPWHLDQHRSGRPRPRPRRRGDHETWLGSSPPSTSA